MADTNRVGVGVWIGSDYNFKIDEMKYVNWITKTGIVEAEEWQVDIESQERIESLLKGLCEVFEDPDDPDVLLLKDSDNNVEHVYLGQWVVKDDDNVFILSREDFEQAYTSQSN